MSGRVQLAPTSFGVILGIWAAASGCAPTNDGGFMPLATVGQGGASAAATTTPASTSVYIYGQGGARPATGVGAGGALAAGGAGVVPGGGATAAGTQVAKGGTPGVVTTTPAATGGAPVVTTTAAATNPNTGTTVTFAAGKGVGAMTGYGFVSLGALDSISSPTCGAAAITSTAPCLSGTTWSVDTALCVTGSIPALDKDTPDYDNNWGLLVGLNATDPATKGLGQAFTSVLIATSGTPTTGLRAKVHRKGDTDSVDYCAAFTPGTAIPFTSFTRTCYDAAKPGAAITAADIPNIDKIQLQVSSGAAAITVTNLCITGITFS